MASSYLVIVFFASSRISMAFFCACCRDCTLQKTGCLLQNACVTLTPKANMTCHDKKMILYYKICKMGDNGWHQEIPVLSYYAKKWHQNYCKMVCDVYYFLGFTSFVPYKMDITSTIITNKLSKDNGHVLNYPYKMDALCIASMEWPPVASTLKGWCFWYKMWIGTQKKNNHILYLYILDTHDVSAFHDDAGWYWVILILDSDGVSTKDLFQKQLVLCFH